MPRKTRMTIIPSHSVMKKGQELLTSQFCPCSAPMGATHQKLVQPSKVTNPYASSVRVFSIAISNISRPAPSASWFDRDKGSGKFQGFVNYDLAWEP